MAREADVHYSSDGLHRTIEAHVQRETDLYTVINSTKNQLQELAAVFVDIGEEGKVPNARGLFKDLLMMQHEVSMHTQALQATKQSYHASEAATDFGALLQDKTQRLLRSHVFDPEQSDDIKDFEKATGPVGGGNDDADVVDLNSDGPMMDKCPLTMKSVWELEQPVVDNMGFIFEKAAIIDYIRKEGRGSRQVKCPVAGTQHMIGEKDLKPATALLERMKRRRKNNPGAQAQAARDSGTVYDADNV